MIQTRTCTYDITYHIVFVTKYRKKIFDSDKRKQELKDILTKLSQGNNSEIIEIEIADDHVHMIVSIPPKIAISDIVKSFKGTSAREWFKLYPEDKLKLYKGHLWSPSFFVKTVGSVNKDIVLNYVKNQLTDEPK